MNSMQVAGKIQGQGKLSITELLKKLVKNHVGSLSHFSTKEKEKQAIKDTVKRRTTRGGKL